MNFGTCQIRKPFMFRFEKWWLERGEFQQLVEDVWGTPCHYLDPLDVWQFKIRLLRKKIKGWALNVNAEIKRHKKDLLEKFDILDVFSESSPLSAPEKDRMIAIQEELEKIWLMEEIKVKQRSRDKQVKEGDKHSLLPGLSQSKEEKENHLGHPRPRS